MKNIGCLVLFFFILIWSSMSFAGNYLFPCAYWVICNNQLVCNLDQDSDWGWLMRKRITPVVPSAYVFQRAEFIPKKKRKEFNKGRCYYRSSIDPHEIVLEISDEYLQTGWGPYKGSWRGNYCDSINRYLCYFMR